MGPSGNHSAGFWSRERTLALSLFLLTVCAIALCFKIALPFLPSLAWAVAIAIVVFPVHRCISKKIPWPNVAAGISLLFVAALIVAPAFFVIQSITQEATSAAQRFQSRNAEQTLRDIAERHPWLRPVQAWLQKQVDVGRAAEQAATAASGTLLGILRGSIQSVVELLIMFFILFFFFRDHQAALALLRSLLPLSNKEVDMVYCRISDTVFATVYGTIVVGFAQGALGGLMFWWLGLPSPFLWGVVMGLLGIVPVLGAFVVWIPAAILLALQGQWIKAIVLTAWGSIVIGLIDNVLYPMLVGRRLRLHTVPVFISIVGGLLMFGAAGLIIGPVALAFTMALVEVWKSRTAEGGTAEEGAIQGKANPGV